MVVPVVQEAQAGTLRRQALRAVSVVLVVPVVQRPLAPVVLVVQAVTAAADPMVRTRQPAYLRQLGPLVAMQEAAVLAEAATTASVVLAVMVVEPAQAVSVDPVSLSATSRAEPAAATVGSEEPRVVEEQ